MKFNQDSTKLGYELAKKEHNISKKNKEIKELEYLYTKSKKGKVFSALLFIASVSLSIVIILLAFGVI